MECVMSTQKNKYLHLSLGGKLIQRSMYRTENPAISVQIKSRFVACMLINNVAKSIPSELILVQVRILCLMPSAVFQAPFLDTDPKSLEP